MKEVENLVTVCKNRSIKLIFIKSDIMFVESKQNKYEFLGCGSYGDLYNNLIKETAEIVDKLESSLTIEVPFAYGSNDLIENLDFPTYVVKEIKNGRQVVLDNTYMFNPVLIDEIALILSKSLDKKGIIKLSSSLKVTLYEWGGNIAKLYGYDNNLIIATEKYLDNICGNVEQLEYSYDEYAISNAFDGAIIQKHQKQCSFNIVYKYSDIDKIADQNIATIRMNLGKKLAESISTDIISRLDFICPVPKTGIYYGIGLAQELNIPYQQALVKLSQKVRSFHVANADVRKEIIWSKITPIAELIKGKRIAIVDEAIFTGTTLKVVCDMLRQCGVKEIHICIPTPKCGYHCEFYVHPERPMLLEYIRESMLQDYFGADSVSFQSDENFVKSLEPLGRMCAKCFFGD
jgi:amidophosphoribosyltransferase